MSGRVVGGGGGKGSTGISAIPAASRTMVLNLKEIVNCPETEIYAMLKDCNMDPNDAVNRLLVQDPFREVKSKREKKKENKDTSEPRFRGASNTSNRGSRDVTDRHARGGSTQFSSNESGALHSKPAYKKENGTHSYMGSASSTSGMAVRSTNCQTPSYSDYVTTENKMPVVGAGDGISSFSQSSPGFQSAWSGSGVPGQKSMADIVKMGRPHGKASVLPNPPQHNVNQHHVEALSAVSHRELHSRGHASQVTKMKPEPDVLTTQYISPNDEWPRVEHPSTASVSSILEPTADSESFADSSNLPLVGANQHIHSQLDEVHAAEDDNVGTHSPNHALSTSISSRNVQEDNSGDASHFDNDMYDNMNSYQHHGNGYEHNEVEDCVSSVVENMQQLNLENDDQTAPPEEDRPCVVIPSHLQVHTPECSHLSFGSFGSGVTATFPGSFASGSLKSNVEEAPTTADTPTVEQSENISSEYYGAEHLRPSDGGLAHRTVKNAENYESPSPSEPEVLQPDIPETAQANHYAFPNSAPGYTFDNSQQLNAAFSHSQTNNEMQNLTPFSNAMPAYTNSLPNTLLASAVQSARDSDLPYSPFLMQQAMASKYSNMTSSVEGLPESLRAGSLSTEQPTQQNLPGVATGPALPQHLAVHPYSQQTLPFANMMGYPFLPQSYTYMPSAFQQAFAGNGAYHQSLAAMLPQYKSSSSLPQSVAASGYGYGSPTNVHGNFPPNPPSAPTGNTVNYDDIISSQYKDSNHLISLQQNDNSGMWVHGPGGRTMPAVQASTYYGFQGQNQQQQQQPGAYRQAQQASQEQFGGVGYPNYYHSQGGMSLEHQQQNPRDGSLGGAQGQPSKQSQQLWQNSY